MKDEAKLWLDYARENLKSAKVLLTSDLYNPCLQNVQQAVEKMLKALLIENSCKVKKTHSITELRNILEINGIYVNLTDEECDFLDSIYLPSKYPVSNVLPYYESNNELCKKGISIAESLLNRLGTIP
ncbi:MAG: HEPN domain-containing protein [bacterium]